MKPTYEELAEAILLVGTDPDLTGWCLWCGGSSPSAAFEILPIVHKPDCLYVRVATEALEGP